MIKNIGEQKYQKSGNELKKKTRSKNIYDTISLRTKFAYMYVLLMIIGIFVFRFSLCDYGDFRWQRALCRRR